MTPAARLEVIDPFTGSSVGSVEDLAPVEVAGRLEQLGPRRAGFDRAVIVSALERLGAELIRQAPSIASTITRESGLCLKDSLSELERAGHCVGATLELLERAPSTTAMREFRGGTLHVLKQPVDLVYAITPFNHPLLQVCHKVLPALAVGAPLLLKPCEKTPLSAVWLVDFLHANGVPKTAIQVATTSRPREVTEAVLQSSVLDVLSFTGSHATWADIVAATGRVGAVTLRQICELGGSSPIVVHHDADLDLAVATTVSGFRNSGQRCTAPRKLFLHASIAQRFLDLLVPAVERLVVGNPADGSTDIGTLIDVRAASQVEERIARALDAGATLLCGGQRVGAQLWPTVLRAPPLNAELMREETFGPVLPVCEFEELDDVIRIVTSSNRYRLAGAIFTRSVETAREFARSLDVGQFSLNGAPGFRLEGAPFGGFGASGNGSKEGIVYAAKGYTKQRTFYHHHAGH